MPYCDYEKEFLAVNGPPQDGLAPIELYEDGIGKWNTSNTWEMI